MGNTDMIPQQIQMQIAMAKKELRECNEISQKFGLVLTEVEIEELVTCRMQALKSTGRIEFGGGILPKLVFAFCDSLYMESSIYEETLADLQDAFYYFKNESMDRFSDDELIEFMVTVFNGRAQGSAEYLTGTSLEALCRYAREGWDPYDAEDSGDLF